MFEIHAVEYFAHTCWIYTQQIRFPFPSELITIAIAKVKIKALKVGPLKKGPNSSGALKLHSHELI